MSEVNAVATDEKRVTPFDEITKMANVVVKSGLFGITDVSQAAALLMLSQAHGLHPMLAVERYHIIQGRPSMKAEAMLAAFQNAGGSVEWTEMSEISCAAIFTSPDGAETPIIKWTIDMAKRAGLIRAGSGWANYPRSMLRSRVISEGVRTSWPSAIHGMYTPDEVVSMPTAREVNLTVIDSETPAAPPKTKSDELADRTSLPRRGRPPKPIAETQLPLIPDVDAPFAGEPPTTPTTPRKTILMELLDQDRQFVGDVRFCQILVAATINPDKLGGAGETELERAHEAVRTAIDAEDAND